MKFQFAFHMSDIIQQEYGANLELVFFYRISRLYKRFSLQDKYNKPIQQNNENNSFPSNKDTMRSSNTS